MAETTNLPLTPDDARLLYAALGVFEGICELQPDEYGKYRAGIPALSEALLPIACVVLPPLG